ncbi:MAG: hypothetical protein P4L53_03650 [Candidatus Obscuribacterales bacterium]|nr:hypothetical protein [Candidatus Obscuribacterales bacterium]
MDCYVVDYRTIVSGLPFVKPLEGRPYVLVGEAGAGKKVFLTEALASTTTLAVSRIMQADLVRQADGSIELDVPSSETGVLVLNYSARRCFECEIKLPREPARPSVWHVDVRSRLTYVQYKYCNLVPLFAGESIEVNRPMWRKIYETGRALLPFCRKVRYETYTDPQQFISFDGQLIGGYAGWSSIGPQQIQRSSAFAEL